MNEDNQPTKEEVEATNTAELQKWEGDFKPEELEVKYSREEEPKEETPAEEVEKEEEVTEPEEEFIYDEPEPLVTMTDPGEYQPKDYSFKVTLDGKTTTLKTVEEAEKFADEHAEELTATELMSLIRKTNKMESSLERDEREWQEQKDAYDEQINEQGERDLVVNEMANEIEYLIEKGMLPKISNELRNADWNDPHVAKQTGVKEQIDLINYMTRENERRNKAGIRPITSVLDAYNGWQMENDKSNKAEETKRAGEARRAAGARVASGSNNSVEPYVPKGIAVGNPNVLKRSASVWD